MRKKEKVQAEKDKISMSLSKLLARPTLKPCVGWYKNLFLEAWFCLSKSKK